MKTRFLAATITLACVLAPCGRCQEGVRDDSHVENVVHKAVADEFSSEILTNRTRAYLSCASGEMVVKINFSEPFRGITYVDYDKTSPCKFYGDGRKYYELRIPLKGCGTKQEAPRVFINNIIVRFHRSLELEEDEIKTIICRYPPPLAPPPHNVIAPIIEAPPILPATKHPKLSEVELLLIICALLFLTLLLLGIGIAYYCLKKRNIKVVKKKKGISSAPASEITKLSGSTMGTLSMFDPIRIPRPMAASTSGSEAALLTPFSAQRSETIPSDYPSESPSSASDAEEVVEQRHVVVSAVPVQKQYDNAAFAAEPYPVDAERAESLSSVQIATVYKPSIPRAKAKPYPVDQERDESVSSLQQAQLILKPASAKQQQLQAITESEDQLDTETVEKSYAAVSRVVAAPPTAYKVEPPVYTKVRKKEEHRPPSLYGSIPDNDDWSHSEVEFAADMKPLIRKPKRTTQVLTDYLVTKQDDTDLREEVTKRLQDTLRSLAVPSQAPDTSVSEITAIPETALAPRKPKITVKNIDEVFVTTEHETIATEHVVKTTKDTTEQLVKSPTTPPSWDVTIRHYAPEDEAPSGPRSPTPPSGQPLYTDRRTWEEDTTEITRATATTTADHHLRTSFSPEPKPPRSPRTTSPPQWDVLNRVITPPPVQGVEELTPDVKTKWRTLVTVDDVFRTLVHEATTTEEYVRISHDFRYEAMFERRVWDVIIRVLTHPDHPPIHAPAEVKPARYRKNQEQRRKSSLPHVLSGAGIPADLRSLPESHRSTSIGDFDMRSMTEIDVDFSRLERESISSDDTVRTGLSITDRATSEYLEDVPSVEGRASIEGYLPVVERMIAAPPVDTEDARSDATFDSGRLGPGGAQGASRTFVERSSRQYLEDLPGSQSRITSDHMRMQTFRVVRTAGLERAPSMDGREEIKSITEQHIYDWLR
ncbi:uncharacterized protein LOC119389329 [Rhipicephalus sanguineus]|uniref:uncharacterized protein LOC119389329 n=1 Tax=Rhipicephalus sanguineus TaxID=34632 RepID=UPI001892EAF5|nr:uncharacterized protein LOC119389329 [Rhipicephalus sanguineus]